MNWEQEARGILRSEMSRRRITYKILAARLEGMGLPETYKSVASKVGRGTFSFTFFLQSMRAMGVRQVDLAPLDDER